MAGGIGKAGFGISNEQGIGLSERSLRGQSLFYS